MLSILLTLACSGGAAPPSEPAAAGPASTNLAPIGARSTLTETADGVAAADLDGDGVDELLFVRDGILTWTGGTQDLGGGFQRAARGDTDGDGREEALIASGMVRDLPTAPARVWRVTSQGAELVFERASPRGQVPELRVVDGRIWVGTYSSSLIVEAGWVDQGQQQTLASGRLATRSLPVEQGTVMARVYGDDVDKPGDLALHEGGQITPLPSFRGPRALAVADLDGDGRDELLAGDGWHKDYGKVAIARLQLLSGADWQDSRAIAHFPLDYSVRELEVLDDGRILVTGTRAAYLLTRDSLGWAVQTIGPLDDSGNAVLVHTEQGSAVLMSGAPASLVQLGS
jgi:hypothetical protein